MSRHAFTLEYLARIRTSTVGTLMTMEFRTMSHRSSVLAVSLDRALETFTFGNSGCIHLIAVSEDVSFDLVLYRILFCVLETELADESLVGNTCLVEVSLNRFANQFVSLVYKTNLNCFVAIVLNGLNLGYYTRASLKNGYRN